MKVELIDHIGTDLDVVNAARVSFNKELDCSCEDKLADKDVRLIRYSADHSHWSPFSHCYLNFRIKAPIFVARQLQKHVVGLAWNEVSRRYVDSEPEFYVPEKWRKKAENVKQGSSEEAVDLLSFDLNGKPGADPCIQDTLECALGYVYADILELYNGMLEAGVCPEQARMVLPQSMMTEWIWSGSLYAFARVCKQRLDSHAQAETRVIAEQVFDHMKVLFPVSTEALLG